MVNSAVLFATMTLDTRKPKQDYPLRVDLEVLGKRLRQIRESRTPRLSREDLVDSPAVADATLEVTDEISSEPHNNAFWIGLAGIGNVSHARHAVLTMGDYRTGFAARVSVATAEGIAQLVVDWEKTNRATLEKLRRP